MAHLLVVDDEESICWCLAKLCTELGHTAATAPSAEDALTAARTQPPDAILLDVRLPGKDGLSAMRDLRGVAGSVPIIVMTAHGTLDTAVRAVRDGAFEYMTKPFALDHAAETIRRALSDASTQLPRVEAGGLASLPDELLGVSPAAQQVFKRIALAAPSEVPVLITGESGTGKELVARAIHRHSLKASAPLLSVNLAALSPTLIESELFGHVRGAFTGADSGRRGLLELADGATVFFDEIGDVPLSVQVKLLRVLEQREVLAVGDATPRKTRFRVIAATNRDLAKSVRQGTFREDLFFRLAGFEIALPALRERVADIPLLAEHFLAAARAAGAGATGFTSEALEELGRRPWPGNVRELRHAVEHAALMARGGPIRHEHLPPARPMPATTPEDPASTLQRVVRHWTGGQLSAATLPNNLYERFLSQVEPALFGVVLEKTGHNRSAAADLLGIHRATLRKRLDG
jgi:two-component system nitrogen regulation response regulator GlnG